MVLKVRSKRYKKRAELVDRTKRYSLAEAVGALRKIEDKKYDETVTLDFQLGVDATTGSENVRGTVSLPHGSGKKVRILCFAKGAAAKEAQAEGADFVGADDLIQKIQGGWFDFDAVVAHPEMMRDVSKVGRLLGPKGLMPTPKTGTVTPQVGRAVKELKTGRIEFKSDKTGGLHAVCGKLSFEEKALVENARSIVRAVQDSRPPATKGDYIKNITLSPSLGPGFRLVQGAL